jgi:hypothetical protein
LVICFFFPERRNNVNISLTRLEGESEKKGQEDDGLAKGFSERSSAHPVQPPPCRRVPAHLLQVALAELFSCFALRFVF